MSESDDKEKAAKIKADLSAWQADCQADPDDHQGVIAGRRRGKTMLFAMELIIDALENPGAQELYAAITATHARELLWDNPLTGLKRVDQLYDLRMKFDNQRAMAAFANQSLIKLFGADSEAGLDKQRGKGNRRVIVDECGSFAPKRLKLFVESIIEPTLADYQGIMKLGGTPGPRLGGPFFEATSRAFFGKPPKKLEHTCRLYKDRNKREFKGKEFGWSMHQASGWKDNPHIPHLRDFAHKLKARKKWPDDFPVWVNEWLGLWMFNLAALVYQYSTEYRWGGGKLPPLDGDAAWHHVCAWHWRAEGDVGIVVCAYNDLTHEVRHVDDAELPRPTMAALAAKLLHFEAKYKVEDFVGTRPGKSRGKGILTELREQYGIFCYMGDLHEETDLIVVSNNDLASGRILVIEDSLLEDRMLSLQWEDPGVKQDTELVSNAVTTAWLYCLKFCNHRGPRQNAPKQGPKPGTPEYLDKLALEAKAKLVAREVRASTDDWLESELGEIDRDFEY